MYFEVTCVKVNKCVVKTKSFYDYNVAYYDFTF